jgi:hypothetical protein
MKNAEITPAVEAKTKGTNQVAVGRRLGLCLSKKFCGPGFGKGSLLKRLVRQELFKHSIASARTKFSVISSGVIPMPLSVTYTFSATYRFDRVVQSTCDDDSATCTIRAIDGLDSNIEGAAIPHVLSGERVQPEFLKSVIGV